MLINFLRVLPDEQILQARIADSAILEASSTAILDDFAAASRLVASYRISTASSGFGENNGSLMTPRGWHYVRATIGAGKSGNDRSGKDSLPAGAVLRGRRWTGEVYSDALGGLYPERDWILSRILWLCGLEPGFNRSGNVDTQRRFVYLHGTPYTADLGAPASHGCIRMACQDIIALADSMADGCRVYTHSRPGAT